MPGKKTDEKKWLQVYKFWNDVPTIMEIDEECFFRIAGQKFRDSILAILRKGIMDDHARENHLSRRYAMSAPEMLPLLKEQLGEHILLTNIYFHLEKLEKANLIKKVAKQLEGKNYVAYYGRTAKLFILRSKDHNEKLMFFDRVLKLSEMLNEDIDKIKLKELNEKIMSRHHELYVLEKEWLQSNHEIITDLEIDVLELFEFIHYMLRGKDLSLQNLLSQYYEELNFKIYKK